MKGVRIFGNEVKISQFADDTNLFCADLVSMENALDSVKGFGGVSGLPLNNEKTKAIWLGKWVDNRTKPLRMRWIVSYPVEYPGYSYIIRFEKE